MPNGISRVPAGLYISRSLKWFSHVVQLYEDEIYQLLVLKEILLSLRLLNDSLEGSLSAAVVTKRVIR
jgi:hypothetical protein